MSTIIIIINCSLEVIPEKWTIFIKDNTKDTSQDENAITKE